MTVAIINQIRAYFNDCTVSDVYLPYQPERYCYALEDIGRPTNVKCQGETCIGEGVYEVAITMSNKYGKPMIQLFNVDSDKSVERDGKNFTGIRVHGGNDVDDSEGCPLVAFNFDGDDSIWGTASAKMLLEVENLLAANQKVYWVISSK